MNKLFLDCKMYNLSVSRIFFHFAQMAPDHEGKAFSQALTFIGQGGCILMAFDHYMKGYISLLVNIYFAIKASSESF